MVARSPEACQNGAGDTLGTQVGGWKMELARAFRDAPSLLGSLGLGPAEVPDLDPAPEAFRILVPRGFAALMSPGDPMDPLLRQVLPLRTEREWTAGDAVDPVGDNQATRSPGLIQKYRGRALLMVHGACAVHCRYCFRRHFPYADLGQASARFQAALAAVGADTSLSEVILSGGDPLMLDDPPLEDLIDRLAALPHLRRLRIHSRLPVVLPERVTDRLCRLLGGLPQASTLVVHTNHPQELGVGASAALSRLRASGVTLLNQGVLLRGINDSAEVLAELSERLFDQGVLPYYLHQLDPVQGANHFRVPDTEARVLLEALREALPGYLVPRLVREFAGEAAKRPL